MSALAATADIGPAAARPLRLLWVLPGLHRVNRGAEVAFESIARELARRPGVEVVLLGSGRERRGEPYAFRHVGCIPRTRFERWPRGPVLRSDCVYEEATFVPGLLRAYRPRETDVTVTCGYPFSNWVLRARRRGGRPAHVFVTQNGDWAVQARNREYRLFGCDGLVCTNPEFYQRHRERWFSALIPNGVDPDVFRPGPAERERFGLPPGAPVVLMVSALIPSKRVVEGLRAAAMVDGVHVVVAGEGPLRREVEREGTALLGERFRRVSVAREEMPALYRSVDAMLHMSLDESFGNAYIEALATGLAVVTHDRMVTRWIFEGRALLVDTQEPTEVSAAIRRALDERSAGAARARRELAVERYAWGAIAGRYLEFLSEVHRRVGMSGEPSGGSGRRAARLAVGVPGNVGSGASGAPGAGARGGR